MYDSNKFGFLGWNHQMFGIFAKQHECKITNKYSIVPKSVGNIWQ